MPELYEVARQICMETILATLTYKLAARSITLFRWWVQSLSDVASTKTTWISSAKLCQTWIYEVITSRKHLGKFVLSGPTKRMGTLDARSTCFFRKSNNLLCVVATVLLGFPQQTLLAVPKRVAASLNTKHFRNAVAQFANFVEYMMVRTAGKR